MMGEPDCCICLDVLSPTSPVTLPCCGESFCLDHIQQWVAVNRSCPLCRKGVSLPLPAITRALVRAISDGGAALTASGSPPSSPASLRHDATAGSVSPTLPPSPSRTAPMVSPSWLLQHFGPPVLPLSPAPASPVSPTRPEHVLDITEVYSRIFIVGAPSRLPTSRDASRNNVDDLANYLSHTFGSRNYVVFRLVSDRSNVDVGRFRSAVLNFPPLLDADEGNLDDGLPGVAKVFHACYAMKFWLDQSPSHVAIVHDTHGRLRSPFFIACFLAWEHAHEFHNCDEAWERISSLRARGRKIFFPPPWRRALINFQTIASSAPTPVAPLVLHKLELYMTGTIKEHTGPVRVEVWANGQQVQVVEVKHSGSAGGGGSGDAFFHDGILRVRLDAKIAGDIIVLISSDEPIATSRAITTTVSGGWLVEFGMGEPVSTEARGVRSATTPPPQRVLLVRYAFSTNAVSMVEVSSSTKIKVPFAHCEIPHWRFVLQALHVSGTAASAGEAAPDTDLFSLQLTLVADVPDSTTQAQLKLPENERAAAAADERRFFAYREWLSLRGRAAQLAGLCHFVHAHTVFPDARAVDALVSKLSLPNQVFARSALQMAENERLAAHELLQQPSFLSQLARRELRSEGSGGGGVR